MKSYKIIAVLLVMGLIFSGCTMIEVNEERDAETVLAQIGEEVVVKGDFQELYDMYVMYGQMPEEVPTDALQLSFYEENIKLIVDQLVDQKVQVAKAKELGMYNLTEEETTEVTDQVNSLLETYITMYQGELSLQDEYADMSEEELMQAATDKIDEYLTEFDTSTADLMNEYTDQVALEKLYDQTVASVEVTEDEVKAEYEKKTAEQALGLTEGTVSYESLANGSGTIYYTPEGVRQAQHILIQITEEDSAKIAELNESGETEEAEKAYEEALANIKDSADDAYNRAVAGEDFVLLIEELGEDPGMTSSEYYVVVEETQQYVPEFAAGLFSLNAVGDITKPVATDYGYHIIKYYGDVPSGETNYDDVRDIVYNELLESKQNEYFIAEMEKWREALDIDVKYDKVLD